MLEVIHKIHLESKSYPELVSKLIKIGVISYTVEVSSGIAVYRFHDGDSCLVSLVEKLRTVVHKFSTALCIQAIHDTQQGKTTYAQFLDEIAYAGVRFYEATLQGSQPQVEYVGVGGSYAEKIPAMV